MSLAAQAEVEFLEDAADMISGDDAAVMLQGLVDLARGKSPTVRTPFVMKADYALAALTLLAVALGLLGAVRARRWARRVADDRCGAWACACCPAPFPLSFSPSSPTSSACS